MASGKISPRQKMINMMYLVLTALLAMNVSSEILNAFKTVNRSIDKTNQVLSDKNKETYSAFEDAIKDPQTKEKATLWKPKADEIGRLSNDMFSFIEKYKQDIKKGAGLKTVKVDGVDVEQFKEDDLDVSTRIMIEQKKGKELFDRVKKYKEDVLNVIKNSNDLDPKMKEMVMKDMVAFEKSLPINLETPAKDKYGKPYAKDWSGWASSNFYMTPAIASMTILTKLQNDVKNSEAQLSDYCIAQLGKVKVVYDKFAAVAAANTTYCMPGEPIEVSAGVGAFNDQAKPVISIKGSTVPLTDGMAVYKFNAGGPGTYEIPVSIRFTTPSGEVKTENRSIKYTVGQPSGAALMLDKMNVFYIGLENPITVSSGTGDEKTNLIPSGAGLTLSKVGPGKYIAKATTVGEATITINSDGKQTPFKFRVKRVPDPVATIGGTMTNGKYPKGSFVVQQGMIAKLDNFDFQAKFDVISYEWTYMPKGAGDLQSATNNGPAFSPQLQGLIKGSKPKDAFSFENVKVKGPDGSVRKIGGLTITLM